MVMKQLMTLLISLVFLGCSGQEKSTGRTRIVTGLTGRTTSITEAEIEKLDSVNIDFQFRGGCYAYSSSKNAVASNGEAHSDNLPGKTDDSFPRQGLYLVINQKEFSKIDTAFLGCKLYLVNTTDTAIKLEASDSRLYIVAEALNDKNGWTPVSYLPSSTCGNSYHTIVLDKDEYWSFNIPVFKGTVKTKIRYILSSGNYLKISSNEIVAYLNKGQFESENKQGYSSDNLMDPYKD
jgi:hypothetical protein